MTRVAFALLLFIICSQENLSAQADDSLSLEEVTISAYLDKQPLLRVPASVTVIDSARINAYPGQSFVSAINTVAGVRMEERSPMSYRLSIRGSLLRSPFGIRNVKVYIDEFPLTDAGGNSYLNLIDLNSIHSFEVLKGPNGSLFGANSGGVVRLSPVGLPVDSFRLSASVGTGSFGFWHEHLKFEKRIGNHVFSISEAVQRSDGYRENSASQRIYFQATEKWNYNPSSEVSAFLFYSNLDYRTPGGLTQDQWNENPRAARPATATLPGASEQKAGVHNRTFYGGIHHERRLGKYFRHVFSVFGSFTEFENPFITNYEIRNENSSGIRSYLEAKNDQQKNFAWKADLGLESQQTLSKINNYENLAGTRGTLEGNAIIYANTEFFFTRLALDLYHRLYIETSASLNTSRYEFVINNSVSGSKNLPAELMPRLAFSLLLTKSLSWRASASRGYSPPTLAEIYPGAAGLNTTLRPEAGWNYETGFRFHDKKGRANWDVCAFYYELENAIVRRIDDNGNDFFQNAGGTKQIGIELQTTTLFYQSETGFLRKLQLINGTTISDFVFSNYISGANDFSGNQLTGVPDLVIVTALELLFPKRISFFFSHNYTEAIPLNDANSVYAASYNVFDLKIGWTHSISRRLLFGANAGVNNLFDEKYSLGNDLNAAGGRYYNVAPVRNYFVSLNLRFG